MLVQVFVVLVLVVVFVLVVQVFVVLVTVILLFIRTDSSTTTNPKRPSSYRQVLSL